MRAVGLQALLQQIQDAEQRRLLTALNDAQLLTRFHTKADACWSEKSQNPTSRTALGCGVRTKFR